MELREVLAERLGDWYIELGEERVIQTLSKPIQFLAKRRFATSADEAIEDLKEHYNRLNTPIGVSQDIKI